MAEFEVLREVWRITEYRNGDVYRTEYVEDRWSDSGVFGRPDDDDQDLIWVTKSDPNVQVIRRKVDPTTVLVDCGGDFTWVNHLRERDGTQGNCYRCGEIVLWDTDERAWDHS